MSKQIENKNDNMMTGTYESTPRGFGFVIEDETQESFFVSASDNLDAFYGDKVLFAPYPDTHGPKREAKIFRIISRGCTEVMGVFDRKKDFGFVIPTNKKISDHIYVAAEDSMGAVDGSIVIVKLTGYGKTKTSPSPEGVVTKVIGHIDDPTTDILQVVYSYNIPVEFPDEVQAELWKIPDSVSAAEMEGRRDMRALDCVTIDGEDAKDLDDAITLSKEGDIYHLGVHIADVSNYVKENSALDREALNRGTSNYLVDSVIPMLPHKLSNGICSLNHGEDRLCLSCLMDIDSSGKVIGHEIVEGVINVNERMNYTDVAAILDCKEDAPVERYKPLIPMFFLMKELSDIIREARHKRGSIDFDVVETKIVADENGAPIDIKPYERNCATLIIEDFMLIANETVAEEYFWADLPFEYRVHESPTVEKVEDLRNVIRSFGIFFKTSSDKIHPKEYQKLLNQIKGEAYEPLISKLTLRSMQQARYSTECMGHFGLACKYYCHFTSPIRRYPDLQIHRIIKENLHGSLDEKRIKHYSKLLPKVAADNSFKERRAVDAEREVTLLKQIEYMEGHIGESYPGVVSGFTNQIIFVELGNTVEGAVKTAFMTDDIYDFRPETYQMVGQRSGKTISLGDKVRIKVVRADKIEKVIDFEFDDDFEEGQEEGLTNG